MKSSKSLFLGKLQDLKSIVNFISNNSKKYAKLQVDKIKSRIAILKSYPKAGKIVLEIDNHNVRELIEGNYRIIYRLVSELQIDILTIHHAAKNLTLQ